MAKKPIRMKMMDKKKNRSENFFIPFECTLDEFWCSVCYCCCCCCCCHCWMPSSYLCTWNFVGYCQNLDLFSLIITACANWQSVIVVDNFSSQTIWNLRKFSLPSLVRLWITSSSLNKKNTQTHTRINKIHQMNLLRCVLCVCVDKSVLCTNIKYCCDGNG